MTIRQRCFLVALFLGVACQTHVYDVPLQRGAPWPKFRRNSMQDGVSPVRPSARGGHLWAFQTGKGIFSSPVIGSDGTVYFGSGDRWFYAIRKDGTLRFKKLTGEVIDSSALLDDQNRVYVPSGDAHLHAFDASTGEELWAFASEDPSTTGAVLNWFEGGLAIGSDGRLLVPCDNTKLYALDRKTGTAVWSYKMADQVWSTPAVFSGQIFSANLSSFAILGDNTVALDTGGNKTWSTTASKGSMTAAPMLTKEGLMVLGGFDGFVRAYDRGTGAVKWEFGTSDHIYASAGLGRDGSILVPSADGVLYALSPKDGARLWAYETNEPLRSSPAIDGDGNIYFGSGEGKLFVLNANGKLRWAMQLITGQRNDLNASPALGDDAILIGGEDGEMFSVPYDYCLSESGKRDERCLLTITLPATEATLAFTNDWGGTMAAPDSIDPNQTLTFSLIVRQDHDRVLALLDSGTIAVSTDPPTNVQVTVSGDRKFLTVTPAARYIGGTDGIFTLHITGSYLRDPNRDGLRFTGGDFGGALASDFSFTVASPPAVAVAMPQNPGDPSSAWQLSRLSVPLPTVMPSYNQIGFESLHYLIGMIEGDGTQGVAWLAGARLRDDENTVEIDPATGALFPLQVTLQGGAITLENSVGFGLNVMNLSLALGSFRVSGHLDSSGGALDHVAIFSKTQCAKISFYGQFLQALGMCNPDTDNISIAAAALLTPYTPAPPPGAGTAMMSGTKAVIVADVIGSSVVVAEHSIGLLLIDDDTHEAVGMDYGAKTRRDANADGTLKRVTLTIPPGLAPSHARVHLIVDVVPVARARLTLE